MQKDRPAEMLRTEETYHREAYNRAESNAMGDGILSADLTGMIILADRVIRQSLELQPGTFLNEAFPELWAKIADSLCEPRTLFDLDVSRGTSRYAVTVTPIIKNDDLHGVVCSFSERTERGELARQMLLLKELSSELSAIINSSSEGLWVCDGDGTVLRINPASERINKVTKEEVVGRNARDLLEQGFFDRSAVLEVLEKGNVINMLQNRGGRKLIITGTPVFDDDNQIIRVVVTERDITEIDKLQRQLEVQEAIKDQFQHHMLELQQVELASHTIIAKSPAMIRALRQAVKVGTADSTVLILGESGVGKGLFADLIHANSSRSGKPLIKINCGAIPESLIESELFGYEKGAFTGAQGSKPGYLELADEGILFLDEIAELPLASQVKLLRFLEDGKVTRLGGTSARTVNVRILAATHRDLQQMVNEKTFRLDLYYRLNVIPLTIPALRERKDCLLPLIRHYIDYFSAKNGCQRRLSRAATDALLAYNYPGNVRELMNICERLVVMAETEIIDLQDLPGQIAGAAPEAAQPMAGWPREMSLEQIMDSVERNILVDAMQEYNNQYRIAEFLGVNQSTVARKLKKYGIN